MLIRSIKTITLAVPLLTVVGCANVLRLPTYGLEPAGTALVRQACGDVMGLPTGVAEFDACGDSLAQSVRVREHAEQIALTNKHCEQQGFERGTAELAKCVVLSRQTVAQSVPAGLAPLVSTATPVSSYWSVNASQQQQRMELSCAHLGLHPASAGFDQCVVNLRHALFMLQNPL